MIKKIGSFLESHVEKMVLIIVGLISAWLFITRVLFSPNMVVYNYGGRSEKMSPDAVDSRILQDAKELKNTRSGSVESEIYPPQKNEFVASLENPLSNIDTRIPPFQPESIKAGPVMAVYDTPEIGPLNNVDVERISAAAYIPITDITRDNPYEDNNCEPNDLDLVTVQAEFDLPALYDEFYSCYVLNVDDDIEPDTEKAEPVFAAIDLQRQEMDSKGSWGAWTNVPRTKIDPLRNLIKISGDSPVLPVGGLRLYEIQVRDLEVQLELLQPQSYQVASAYEEWLPPKLHRDYLDALEEERDIAREEEREQRPNNTTTDTNRRSGGRRNDRNIGGGLNTNTRAGTRRRGGNTDDTAAVVTTTTQEEAPTEKVYTELEEIILSEDTDLSDIDEPVTIWAHDDTVEPGKVYRYRMRLGVLNPTAADSDDEIIFWSDFSDVTDNVDIPQRTYFFPTSVQQPAKTVNVSIYKVNLGYWYKHDFKVSPGEIIGKVVEYETDESDEDIVTSSDVFIEPESINFSTGATMINVVAAEEPGGTADPNSRQLYNMLYSYNGNDTKQMIITNNSANRPEQMREDYTFVQKKIREARDKEPLKLFGESGIDVQQLRTGQYRYRPRN